MLKRRLGMLVLLLLLGAAPGCRAIATVTAAVGIVALDVALDDDDSRCDCGRRHCRHRH